MSTDDATGLVGRWRITSMEAWAQEDVDSLGKAGLRIDAGDTGEMRFLAVTCELDVEHVQRSGRAAIEWSWQGDDDGEPASGRGWAVQHDAHTLRGKVYFFQGDASAFTARRVGAPKAEGPAAQGTAWSAAQDEALRAAWEAGQTVAEIATRLNRSTAAIAARLVRVGCVVSREEARRRG